MIEGGVSMISKGYAEANNEFLKSYDHTNVWSIYDANSLK